MAGILNVGEVVVGMEARITELENALRGIEDLCQRGAGEDADMDAQEALMQIWEAARKVLGEGE